MGVHDSFSYTRLSLYSRCPQAYFHRYIEGKKIPPNGALIKGREVHRIREKSLLNKQSEGVLFTPEQAEDFAATSVDAAFQEEILAEEGKTLAQEKGEIKDSVVTLAKLDLLDFQPKINPIAVEKEVRFRIEGIDREIITKIDTIDGGPDKAPDQDVPASEHILRDLKTTGRTPSEKHVHTDPQLVLYRLGHKVEYGEYPKIAQLDVLVELKTPKSKEMIANVPEGEEQRVVNKLASTIDAVDREAFPPTLDPIVCNPEWCGFWKICLYGERGRIKGNG